MSGTKPNGARIYFYEDGVTLVKQTVKRPAVVIPAERDESAIGFRDDRKEQLWNHSRSTPVSSRPWTG